MVAWEQEEGQEGGITKGVKKLLEVIDKFITWTVVMVSQVYTYIKIDQIVIFKHVQLIACQLYLNEVWRGR